MTLDDAQGDVLSELLALRLELNAQDQDWSAVQLDALAYLEIGGPREVEIRTLQPNSSNVRATVPAYERS